MKTSQADLSERRTRRYSWLAVLGVVVAVGPAMTDCGFRNDEFDCEEAAAHIAACCPGVDIHALNCTYTSDSCGTVLPDLTVDESTCIVGMTCSQLQPTVCARVAGVAAGSTSIGAAATSVCP